MQYSYAEASSHGPTTPAQRNKYDMPKEQVWDTPKLTVDQRAELVRRAYAAWFKAGGIDMPDSDRSGVKVRLGLVYVVLHGAAGVLAVYRVRPDNLALRVMKRWPESVEK